MRPLKLKLQAIGPFAKDQEIDFQKLTNGNIFIISGKTGSGKSTIFDAIMYALFDSPSIESRDKESLRSDFAAVDVESYVELTFISQQKTYRIKRMPKQQRVKKRGTGFKLDEAKVEFYLEDECISTKVNETNKKIVEILGINAKQFRQIIMLAQGEFKKLLVADSKEREEIFRKIFQTENYLILQDKLKNKTSELKKEINTSEIKLATIFKQEEIEYDMVNAKLALKELEQKKESKKKIIEQLKSEISESQKIINKLETNQQNINKLNELKQELKTNKTTHVQLLANEETINELIIKLEHAKKYQRISSLYYQGQEFDKNKLNIERKQEENQKLIAKIETLNHKILSVEMLKEYEQVIIENSKEKAKIEQKQEKLKNELLKIKEVKHLKEKTRQKLKEINEMEENIKSGEQTLDAYNKALEQVNDIENNLKEETINLKTLNHQISLIESKQKLNEKLQVDEQYFEKLFNEFKKLSKNLVKNEEYFYLNQASILANNLKSGEPCPVCGAIEHPNLAQIQTDIVVTKTELDDLKQRVEILRTKVNDKSIAIGKNKKEIELLSNQIVVVDEQVILQQKDITSKIEKLKQKLKTLKQFIAHNQNIETKIGQLTTSKLEIEKEINVMQGKCEVLNVDNQDLDIVNNQINEMAVKLIEINNNTNKYQNKLNDNLKEKENLVKLETTFNTTKTQLDRDLIKNSQLLATNREQINQYLTENNLRIDNIEKYLQTDALKLQAQINDYQNKLKQVVEKIENNQDEIKKLEQITEFSNVEKIAEYKDNHSKLLENSGSYSNELMNIKNSIKQVEKLFAESSEQLSLYQLYANLERVANGQNEHYLSFERYILAIYFDEIIKYANLRLKRLTDNRYSFKRNSQKIKGQRQRGLDLVIYDFYTAKERDVTTLSGGESFKAAIALALGLSDAMRIENGGIELETLFIDEGFGTLDEESLEMAIDVLNDLQSDGRLIGVISHVNLLKERISQQVLVEKSNVGSQVKLQIN